MRHSPKVTPLPMALQFRYYPSSKRIDVGLLAGQAVEKYDGHILLKDQSAETPIAEDTGVRHPDLSRKSRLTASNAYQAAADQETSDVLLRHTLNVEKEPVRRYVRSLCNRLSSWSRGYKPLVSSPAFQAFQAKMGFPTPKEAMAALEGALEQAFSGKRPFHVAFMDLLKADPRSKQGSGISVIYTDSRDGQLKHRDLNPPFQ